MGGRRRKTGSRGFCGGCGFMMVAVQGLPWWMDVSRGTGFVVGREVSSKERGW